MQKHPRISSGSHPGICPFTPQVLHQFLQLSPHAYQRYIRKVIISPSASFGHQGLSPSLWLLFGVIHQVFASFQHCPFRGFA
jgi:hypothetical protein